MSLTLPTGRRGQILALALALIALAAVWFGLAQPLLAWHAERAEALSRRRALYDHMLTIAHSLPALQRQASRIPAAAPLGTQPASALLEGNSDAIAGAALQEQLQEIAAHVGATLTSTDTLPAEAMRAYRRIGLRISLTVPWPVLVELLRAAEQARPRMVIDDLQVQGSHLLARQSVIPLEASFIVFAFRAATTPTRSP